jgi:ATP-dependent RNA helicase DeaD
LLEQGHTPTDIAGALVTLLREAGGREGTPIDEDREPERAEAKPRPRADRSARGKGPPRDSRAAIRRGPTPHEPGMARLFISLGKAHGILPKDIVGMMYREGGLPDGSLGRITLFPKHTLVDVPEDFAKQAIRKTGKSKLRGMTFRIDFDRGPAPSQDGPA